MPTKRASGRYYCDLLLDVVGRINISLKTGVKEVAVERESAIRRLAREEEWAALRALKAGKVGIAELTDACRRGASAVHALVARQDDPKIEGLIDDFVSEKGAEIKTAERYGRSLRYLLKWEGAPKGARLSWLMQADTINAYKRSRLGSGQSPDTVCRDLAAIHQLIEWKRGRRAARDAFAEVRWPRPSGRRTRRLSEDEIRRLLKVALETQLSPYSRYPYHDIYRTMLLTGLRPSEIERLRVKDVDPERRLLRVADSKTEAGVRWLPLPAAAAPVLAVHLEGKEEGEPVFGIPQALLSQQFRHHARRAKIPDVKLRDLRRTHAQALREATGDMVKVRDQLGHTTVRHTEFYAGMAGAEERRSDAEEAARILGLAEEE